MPEDLTLRGLLRGRLGFSRRLIRRLKAVEGILVNNTPARLADRIKPGDTIHLLPIEEQIIQGESLPWEELVPWILYEDGDLLIINKPSGLVVHPTGGYKGGTLLNYLHAYFQAREILGKAHFVNRLDRETSGIILIAKNPLAHHHLAKTMAKGQIYKGYAALIKGQWPGQEIHIDLPIRRIPLHPVQREIHPEGQRSITIGKLIYQGPGIALINLRLITGRTHQIRVHLSCLGVPLLGDKLYGHKESIIPRQALHAQYLEFPHPFTKEQVKIKAPLPADMALLIKSGLRSDG